MKPLYGFLFALFVATIVASDLEEWNAFKLNYGKNYQNETEDNTRMEIFLENMHKVTEHNEKHTKGLVTYKMGLNKFSDLMPDELNVLMKGSRPPDLLASHVRNETNDYLVDSHHKHHHHHHHRHHRQRYHHHLGNISYQHLPESIDWRNEGAVNEDKSQGSCGSCWAFTATGAIEGQHFRKTGKLIQLSEQNLIDCVNDCGCGGCSLSEAYQYVQMNGINTADEYPTPYMAEDGLCQSDNSNIISIIDYHRITEGDEAELQEAIASVGPISVSIDARHSSFYQYSSGIYNEPDCSSSDLHHDVLVVGYGTDENGQDYYIVKNWWGPDWGENLGYFRLIRNFSNNCGIATRAMYPIL